MCAATPQQLEFLGGLDRKAKNADINAMRLPETRHVNRQVRDLLRALDGIDHGDTDGRCWSIEELARILDWSPRKVKRVCSIATAHEVLLIQRRRDPMGRSLPSEYHVQWETVRRHRPSGDLYSSPKPKSRREPADRPTVSAGFSREKDDEPPGGHFDTPGGQNAPPGCQVGPYIKEDFQEYLILTSPLHSCADWGRVEEELSKRGLAASQAAIAKARQLGAEPAEILAVIGHYDAHPGAWGEGALFVRVSRHVPGEPASAGWMPMAQGYLDDRRRAVQTARQASRQAQDERDRRRAEQDRLMARELELHFGGKLDAMSREERRALAVEAFGEDEFLVAQAMRGTCRHELLMQLNSRCQRTSQPTNFQEV